jgi:hypothetical protein
VLLFVFQTNERPDGITPSLSSGETYPQQVFGVFAAMSPPQAVDGTYRKLQCKTVVPEICKEIEHVKRHCSGSVLALLCEAAAEIPGTQTVYPPDKDDPSDGEQPPPAAWADFKNGCKLLKEAEAARAIADVERVAQAVRGMDEIGQAADARRVRKDYPARSRRSTKSSERP